MTLLYRVVGRRGGEEALCEIGHIFILSSAHLKKDCVQMRKRKTSDSTRVNKGRLIGCKLTTHMLILTRAILRRWPFKRGAHGRQSLHHFYLGILYHNK